MPSEGVNFASAFTAGLRHDEMEERIWEDITDVGRHLLGMVSGPRTPRSARTKGLNHVLRMELDLRSQGFEPEEAMDILMPARQALAGIRD